LGNRGVVMCFKSGIATIQFNMLDYRKVLSRLQ